MVADEYRAYMGLLSHGVVIRNEFDGVLTLLVPHFIVRMTIFLLTLHVRYRTKVDITTSTISCHSIIPLLTAELSGGFRICSRDAAKGPVGAWKHHQARSVKNLERCEGSRRLVSRGVLLSGTSLCLTLKGVRDLCSWQFILCLLVYRC